MDYATARPSIQTGDLLGVRDIRGIPSRLVALVTRSPYTHTGVAIWVSGRLFMADLNSGRNHLTAVSCLGKFDVFRPPAGLPRDLIEEEIYSWLAKPINYGYLAFLVIGIKSLLRLKLFIHWRKIIVCSGGSVQIYQAAARASRAEHGVAIAGWEDHDQMISPGDLCGELELKFPVGN